VNISISANHCRNTDFLGARCGASYIDQEFLHWLGSRVKGLDTLPSDLTTGGHYIATKSTRFFLQQFEEKKHAFSGEEMDFEIAVPTDVKLVEEHADGEDSGVISLTT
jgi:hypothetical protein